MEQCFTDTMSKVSTDEITTPMHNISQILHQNSKHKHPILAASQDQLLQQLFTKAIDQFQTLPSLIFLSFVTQNIKFSECVGKQDTVGYFQQLLPLAKEVIEEKGANSEHTSCLLDILSSIMDEMESQPSAHPKIWGALLSLFEEVKAIKELNTFLRKNINLSTDLSLWKNHTLDRIVLDTVPNSLDTSIDLNTLYKFLYFTIGGNMMTKSKYS